MKKNISDFLQRYLSRQDKHHILIKDTNFFADLVEPVENGNKAHSAKRIFMFCIIAICLAFCIISIVTGTIFYIKDILLFNRPPIVTESGSIVPQRSCNREQVIFFFNAADCWAGTGVQLLEGDKIRISHSGGFYSDIFDLYTKSIANDTLKYPYYDSRVVNGMLSEQDTTVTKYTLYNNENKPEKEAEPRFGSILWQISNENSIREKPTEGNIHQIEPHKDYKDYITIEENGEIFFSVNDIFLDSATLDKRSQNWEKCPKDSLQQLPSIHDKIEYARKNNIDYVCYKEACQTDTTFSYRPEDIELYLAAHPEDRYIWFNDNVGNVMICIEIVRHVREMPWYAQWYRETEDMFFNDLENIENFWYKLFIIIRDGLQAIINLGLQILILPIRLIYNPCYYELSEFLWKYNSAITILFFATGLSIIYFHLNRKKRRSDKC